MVTKNIVTPITYLCELTIKVINILQSIHAKGIMHRDLKPQNIMLQGDCVYLIDFGISEIMTSNPVKKRAFVGNTEYTQELPDTQAFRRTKDVLKHPLTK